jgi:hypothetical protein
MKRFAPLAVIVLAFAIAPVAFADDTTPPASPAAHPAVRLHVEILRLRLQLVHLRYRIVCHKQDSDRCTQFTQKIVDRLTKLDGNVQAKIDELKCTSDSSDKKCTVLAKIDAKLKDVIAKLGSPSSSSDTSLDQAASDLGKLTQP